MFDTDVVIVFTVEIGSDWQTEGWESCWQNDGIEPSGEARKRGRIPEATREIDFGKEMNESDGILTFCNHVVKYKFSICSRNLLEFNIFRFSIWIYFTISSSYMLKNS